MPAGVVSVGVLADFAELIEQSNAAGMSIEAFSGKVVTSARTASRAMADYAKAQGASAEEAKAAAAKTAAAWDATYGSMSKSSKDAGNAALATSRLFKESADEQTAAFARAAEAQKALEAQQKAAADAAAAAAAKTAAAAEASAARVAAAGKKLAAIGKWSLFGGVAGVAASVKGAADLQTSMERLHTQAGVSQGAIKGLTGSVLNMAGSLATSPDALAQSLYHVESGGVHGAAALKVMATAAKEAKVSGADLTDTTTALTATVFSGIQGAQNYAKAMGLLNATVGAGDMTFQDLNEALGGPMLATVKGYGLSLKDVGAALATFGDLNIRGADAATQLRMAVQYMAKPAATAGPILQKLGLSTNSFADAMSKGGLLPALQLLNQHLEAAKVPANDYAQVISDIFTKKGAAGVTILENSLTKLEGKYQEVGKGANQVNQGWAGWNKTLAADVDHLKATVQSLADKFGTALIPKLSAAAHAVSDVIGWFEKHKTAAQALAGVITGVLAGAITAFAVTQAMKFIGGVRNMAAGVQYLVKLLPGLGATATATAGEVGAAGEAIVADSDATAAGVDAALGATGVGAVVVGLGIAGAELATHWKSVMAAMKDAVGYFVGAAETDLNALIDLINHAIDGLNKASSFLNTISFGAVAGGQVGHIGHVGVNSAFSGITPDRSTGGTGVDLTPAGLKAAQSHLPGFSSAEKVNAAAIMQSLMKGGLSAAGAAALAGNWVQENSLNASSDTASGLGLAQWMGPRRTAEMQYAKSKGLPYNTVPAETEFALQELKGYPSLLAALQSGKLGPQQLALMVSNQYERPNAQYANNPHRESAAQQIYSAFGGKGKFTTPSLRLVSDKTSGGGGSGGGSSLMNLIQNLASGAKLPALLEYVAARSRATQTADQANRAQAVGQAQVTVLQAINQRLQDQGAAQVQSMKDQQAVTDQASAIQVQAIKNQTQVIQDMSAITVATIQGAAQKIADASNAQATEISDNAQIQADTISERGLYGLNLVVQKLQVNADEVKAYWDRQIATAQQQLDSDQMAANVANAQAQLATDQVTATEGMKVLQAQQNLNLVTLREDAKVNAAKAHLDSVTINQDNRILRATQHADAVQLSVDTTKIGPAQTAVDLNANSSKTVQTAMQDQLKLATAQGQEQINAAQLQLANVTSSANQTIGSAQNAYQSVMNAANADIQSATNAYQSAQDSANQAIANAQQTQAMTAAQWAQILQADQALLSGTQGSAATAEAGAQGAVTTTQARASTQFAGSGLVVNMYGVDLNNAGMVASEASWAIRTSGLAA